MTPSPDPTDVGITIPLVGPLAESARELTAAGYGGLWSAETATYDAFTPLAAAAAAAPGATVGAAIASVFARGPGLLAMSAAALADLAPGRFLLGIGASSATMTEDWHAATYDRPLARVRDTARFLRAALGGEKVSTTYETFAVRGFRLERPPATPPPVLVAALAPGMARLGVEEADGLVLNWLSAADVTTVLGWAGAPGTVAARIFVCPSTATDTVRTAARRLVSTYATVPGYARFHRRLGRGPRLERTWTCWAAGDRRAATAAVPDEVVDDLIVHGSPDECARRIRAYVDAGVTHPVVKLLPLDPDQELRTAALTLGAALKG
jgi:probable F420-dependent oxidoreductase